MSDIKRATRKPYSSEEKSRIVLDGLRGEDSVLNCAAVKAYRRASITNGQRTSWKPERSDLLAAMQGIPAHLYEAALIDGATRRQMFFTIKLPLIGGAIVVSMTTAIVAAFNLFDEAWVLAGSSLDTRSVLVQIYHETFLNLNFSYGMALSLVITFVSPLFVLRLYRTTKYD